MSRTSPLRMARQEGRTARERVRTHTHAFTCVTKRKKKKRQEADTCAKGRVGGEKKGFVVVVVMQW